MLFHLTPKEFQDQRRQWQFVYLKTSGGNPHDVTIPQMSADELIAKGKLLFFKNDNGRIIQVDIDANDIFAMPEFWNPELTPKYPEPT